MSKGQDRTTHYKEGSLSLAGTVMLGTGVMIGAGIFALTGQVANVLDLLALGGFAWVKLNTDPFVIEVAVVGMILIAIVELIFLKKVALGEGSDTDKSHAHHD